MSSFTTDIEESLTDLKIKGYTEWATHLSKDDDYQIFRRFNALHLRAILHYQDRLRELEDKLYNQNKIAVDLSRRDDRNKERGALVEEITLTLNLYAQTLTSHQVLRKFASPTRTKLNGLRESINYYKPLSEEELRYADDFPTGEFLIVEANRNSKLAEFLTRRKWLANLLRLQDEESRQKTKRDGGKTPYYSDLRIHTFRKLLLLLVCIIFIVVPVIILSLYPNGIHRLVIFVIFIVTFVCFFLFLDASDLEVYGVSAGYAAVLSAVFVATNDVLNSSSSQPL